MIREFFRIPPEPAQVQEALRRNNEEYNMTLGEIEALNGRLKDETLDEKHRKAIEREIEKKIKHRLFLEEEHHQILVKKGIM